MGVLHDLHARKVINAGGANHADGPFGATVFPHGKVLLLAPLVLLAGALAWVLVMSVLIAALRTRGGGKHTRNCRAQALQHTLSRARAIPVPGRAPSNRRRHALPPSVGRSLHTPPTFRALHPPQSASLTEAQGTSHGSTRSDLLLAKPPLPRDGESSASSFLSKEPRGSMHIPALGRDCTTPTSWKTSSSPSDDAAPMVGHATKPATRLALMQGGTSLGRRR